jgi:hypothetical protein
MSYFFLILFLYYLKIYFCPFFEKYQEIKRKKTSNKKRSVQLETHSAGALLYVCYYSLVNVFWI